MIGRQGTKMRGWALRAAVAGALAFAPAALAAPGDLDPGFGHGAPVTLAPGGAEAVLTSSAAQPDGRVVVAGLTRQPDPVNGGEQTVGIVARYDSDGTPDETFGSGGTKTIELGGTHICLPVSNWNCPAYVLAKGSGKIIVALNGAHGGGHGASSALLVRLTPDGELDQAFGRGTGEVLIPRFAARGLATAGRGRIVIGGISGGHSVVARYLPSGRPDVSFGSSGIARTGNGRYLVHGIARQNGRTVTVGEECAKHRCGNGDRFAATRVNSRGRPDHSFTKNGMTTVGRWGHVRAAGANAVAIDRSGRIALAGYADTRRAGGGRRAPKFAVVRLRRDGRVDRSFAGNGRATTWFGSSLPDVGGVDGTFGARSVAADGNELYLAGGAGRDFAAGAITLAAYTPHGRLDRGFGNGGKVRTAPPQGSPWDCAVANSASLVAAGRLAVAGYQYGCDEEEADYNGPPDAGIVALYDR